MSLSSENIQFIDNYLKNSEVIYYDIRMEMLDHVATAVEQKMEAENLDFYDAFKSYMMVNKKEILKGNKFWSIYSKDTILSFLKFLLHPIMFFIGIFFYIFFDNINVTHYFSESFSINNLFFTIILSIAFFQIFYFYIYLKERLYVIEKWGGLLVLLYYAQIFFFPGYSSKSPSNLVMAIFFYLLFAYLVYFIIQILKFNQKNKHLFQ
jgi:hypothetical protein